MSAPRYAIMTGELSAMYTLRVFTQTVVKYDQWSWEYICNLSTDKDRALEKAKEVLGGLGTIEFLAPEDLNEYRIGIGEYEKSEAARRKIESEQAKEERKQYCLELVKNGIYPFGCHNSEQPSKISNLSRSSLSFWANADVERESVAEALQEYIIINLYNRLLPEPKAGHLGELKERLTLTGTVVRVGGFVRDSFDPWGGDQEWCSVTTIVTDKGHMLTVFSTSWCGEVGDVLKFKATVKEHSEYEGIPQTVIQRINVIEVLDSDKN